MAWVLKTRLFVIRRRMRCGTVRVPAVVLTAINKGVL